MLNELARLFEVDPLVVLVCLPAATALTLAVSSWTSAAFGFGALPSVLWRVVGFASAIATFALAGGLAAGFDAEQLGLQWVSEAPWVPSLGANVAFGLDGIGLFFVLATTAVVPLSMVSTWRTADASGSAGVIVTLCFESALLGALVSSNLLVFIGFWVACSLPLLVWMGRWGGLGRARAATRLWTMEAIGFGGLLFVAFVMREASLQQLGTVTLDLAPVASGDLLRGGGDELGRSLLDLRLDASEQWPLFLAFSFALATRLPLVPLHFWLPAAHAVAPAGLSVLIATGFAWTAAIGWLRFALPLFPDAVAAAGPILSLVGIVAFAYASLIALVQKELKRLVAFASCGSAGFALFGISTLNVQGLTGAVLQLLTHGLATAGLFVLIDFLSSRRGTTEVSAFGGLAKPMPVAAFFFALLVLSLMGVPLLGGFVGDLFVLLGSLETRRGLSVFALIAMIVAASYLLWVQRRLFLGPVDEPANRGLIDLDRLERGVLLVLTVPLLLIGIHPNPVLRRVEPAVLELLYQMDRDPSGVPSDEPGLRSEAEPAFVRGEPPHFEVRPIGSEADAMKFAGRDSRESR